MQETGLRPQPEPQWIVVGINIAVVIAYTIYLRYVDKGQYNIIGDAMLIGMHVVICLLLAIFVLSKEFLMSAALVLVIGFSTCWTVFATKVFYK
ncbi:hypothetical protein [Mucilaginibacter pedocola]|uniref:Uncharacterized protein n=1 Tax=Mucilaginibacter pedocola TaxID=1792845 RepID=A0A1S9PJB7_9SPHI|nr:hypothetical protein [Mucilaginibacter pedocola]OOQ61061.1 hypothetical protein BC343_21675 [Mucilaginibacter pedocola]